MSGHPEPLRDPVEADPFELPDWLGDVDVVWLTDDPVTGAARVAGSLRPHVRPGEPPAVDPAQVDPLPCDLLAADHAFPLPLLDPGWRARAHQQWSHGEVLLLQDDDRLVLAAPGYAYTADGVLQTLGRLAKAVGVRPGRFHATLRP